MINPLPDIPEAGETRRVVVESGEEIGFDAVVTFRDLERPGKTYQAIVSENQCPDGLNVNDLAVIRWQVGRKSRRHAGFTGWFFVTSITDPDVVADVVERLEAQACA
jgi:hypothetical protein